MKIEDLIKVIEVLKAGDISETQTPTEHDFVGKKVLIRANNKGVQIGIVVSVDSEFLKLSPSRKLWRWQAKKGLALESVAKYGITDGTKATAIVDTDYIRKDDCCGITELTQEIYDNIMNYEEADQC